MPSASTMLRLTKDGQFWYKHNPRRAVKVEEFDNASHGKMIAFSIIKFGSPWQRSTRSRVYYGRIINQTETMIEFEPMKRA